MDAAERSGADHARAGAEIKAQVRVTIVMAIKLHNCHFVGLFILFVLYARLSREVVSGA